MVERLIVRILVAIALCMALLAFAFAPIPIDVTGNPHLPAPALGQPGLYRLEVALFVFYGDLLLVTPAFSGLIRARLPIEISTRGARFADETGQAAEVDKAAVNKLELTTEALTEDVLAANLDLERLRDAYGGHNTQRKVDSEP